MSDKPSGPPNGDHHRYGTAGSAAGRSDSAAVPDTFPASDPVASTPVVGARTENLVAMMDAPDELHVPNSTSVTAHFPDHVTAKLAVEKLVRDVPIDRRSAALSKDSSPTMLEVTSSEANVDRVTEILRGGGGDVSE
jgi:hypothetical protein